MKLDRELTDILNRHVVVAAVGPICSAAVEAAGVVPRVVPQNPKMSPLITALAEYFARDA